MQREVSLQDCSLANCLHTKPCVISRFFEHIFAFFLHATPRLPRSSSTAAQLLDQRTTHRPPRSTSTTDTAPRPPTQLLDHRHSSSTTDTAHRPPTQLLDHRHSSSTTDTAPRPPTQLLDHRHSSSATHATP